MKLLYLGISCKYKVTLSFAVSIPVNHLVRQYIEAFHEFHSIVNKTTWDKEPVFTGNHLGLHRSGDI